MHDIDKDPHLPRCFIEYPEQHKEAKEWVVSMIKSLNPNWWESLSRSYDKAFNHTSVYKPYQEVNARRRMANLWLRETVKKYSKQR